MGVGVACYVIYPAAVFGLFMLGIIGQCFFFVWLVGGLLLALPGLWCKNRGSRVLAVIAVCVFLFVTWFGVIRPFLEPPKSLMRLWPNKALQPTAAGPRGFDRDMRFDCQDCIGKSGSAAVAELGRYDD